MLYLQGHDSLLAGHSAFFEVGLNARSQCLLQGHNAYCKVMMFNGKVMILYVKVILLQGHEGYSTRGCRRQGI